MRGCRSVSEWFDLFCGSRQHTRCHRRRRCLAVRQQQQRRNWWRTVGRMGLEASLLVFFLIYAFKTKIY